VILRQLALLAAVAGLAACAHDPTLAGAIWDTRAGTFVPETLLLARAAAAQHVILGEIHDNPEHHRLQLRVLERLGRRVLAMEQFDSEHQAAIDAEESRASQCVPDMNPPSTSRSEPRLSPANEPAQEKRAARLDELLARADRAAQRFAAQQAERHASNDYAARMELEAQTQAEAGIRHKPGRKPSSSCNAAARACSRTSPLIRSSIGATACASLPHA